MSNRGRVIVIAMAVFLAGLSTVRADNHSGETGADEVQRLRGRDIVKLGELIVLQGTLVPRRGEWFLRSGETEYELHMGNHEYRKKIGIDLETGKTAAVTGFIHGKDVAVTTILLDGKLYRFREDDGKPLWAGMAGGTGSGQEGGSGREDGSGRKDGSGREDGRGRGSGGGGSGGGRQ